MTQLPDADVRARILSDIYSRRRQGLEILSSPQQYAQALGISEESAVFMAPKICGFEAGAKSSRIVTLRLSNFIFKSHP